VEHLPDDDVVILLAASPTRDITSSLHSTFIIIHFSQFLIRLGLATLFCTNSCLLSLVFPPLLQHLPFPLHPAPHIPPQSFIPFKLFCCLPIIPLSFISLVSVFFSFSLFFFLLLFRDSLTYISFFILILPHHSSYFPNFLS
jgi:hypothetical protein